MDPIHSSQPSRPRDIAVELRDFTAGPRLLLIALFAIVVGVISAFVAKALLALIGLFTNLFFFQRVSTALVTPDTAHLGAWVILIPVAGALIIGAMARYGSDRIRGHGIPEAIEAILINGSRVEPKVALLKPLSSAICCSAKSCAPLTPPPRRRSDPRRSAWTIRRNASSVTRTSPGSGRA